MSHQKKVTSLGLQGFRRMLRILQMTKKLFGPVWVSSMWAIFPLNTFKQCKEKQSPSRSVFMEVLSHCTSCWYQIVKKKKNEGDHEKCDRIVSFQQVFQTGWSLPLLWLTGNCGRREQDVNCLSDRILLPHRCSASGSLLFSCSAALTLREGVLTASPRRSAVVSDGHGLLGACWAHIDNRLH